MLFWLNSFFKGNKWACAAVTGVIKWVVRIETLLVIDGIIHKCAESKINNERRHSKLNGWLLFQHSVYATAEPSDEMALQCCYIKTNPTPHTHTDTHTETYKHANTNIPPVSAANLSSMCFPLCQMVNLLLAKGANINAFDKKDGRALHWAAFMGKRQR